MSDENFRSVLASICNKVIRKNFENCISFSINLTYSTHETNKLDYWVEQRYKRLTDPTPKTRQRFGKVRSPDRKTMHSCTKLLCFRKVSRFFFIWESRIQHVKCV